MTKPSDVALQIDTSTTVNAVVAHSRPAGWKIPDGTSGKTISTGSGFTNDGGNHIRAFISGISSPAIVESPLIGIAPGQYIAAQVNVGSSATTSPTAALSVAFYGSSGVQIGTETYPTATACSTGAPTGTQTMFTISSNASAAPAGTAYARVRIKLTFSGTTPTFYFSRLMAVTGATSRSVTGVAFAGPTWTDIVGDAVSIDIHRGGSLRGVLDELEVGTLDAVIDGVTYSPLVTSSTQPGRQVRVVTTNGAGATLFTGFIDSADLVYGKDKGRENPTLALRAVDAIPMLRSVNVPQGVNTVDNPGRTYGDAFVTLLDWCSPLAGFVSIGGTAGGPASLLGPVRVDASLWDHLMLLRNANPTKPVYVGADGVIRMTTEPASGAVTFSRDSGAYPSFLSINLGFRSANLVNSLTVHRLASNEPDGEKIYGPYLNAASIQQWRQVSNEIEIAEGSPSAVAATYLQAFSTPRMMPSEYSFDAADSTTATELDLYAGVRVAYTAAGMAGTEALTLIGIQHQIRPRKWIVTHTVRPTLVSGSDVITYPAGGASAGPADLVIQTTRFGAVGLTTSGGQAISNSTSTVVQFDQVKSGSDLTWNATNRTFTASQSGRYVLATQVTYKPGATTGRAECYIEVNGSAVAGALTPFPATSQYSTVGATSVEWLNVGDTIRVKTLQNSGATRTLHEVASGQWCFFRAAYLGA